MRLAEISFPAETPATEPPLIVAHGLFGAARNWRAHAKRMGAGRDVIVVDMRNHANSGWDDLNDYPAMADDLAETILAHGGKASVVGHSMGGKAAMALAQTHAQMIDKLIVADIAPVAYDHSLTPQIEAMQNVDLSQLTRKSEVDAALASEIDEPAVRAFLAQSADLAEGAKRWALNLSALNANMDLITDYPGLTGIFTGPTLFLYGGASDYVPESSHPLIRKLFPATEFQVLEGAGHWLHAEKPREFLTAVTTFLSK
ncbi:MAG: alpha/beta fold hydrolase [Pikeienuella sp.]